jgi:HK97 gp10 family phage protein
MVSEGSADITALAQRLQRAGESSQEALMNTLMQAATQIAATMKSLCPVDTGNLRDSIGVRSQGDSIVIGPDMGLAPYAGYVEFGTAPHEIRPKTAKALRFTVGGKVVFARVVHHPGTRPAYYVAGAFEQWLSQLGPMAATTGARLITHGSQA